MQVQVVQQSTLITIIHQQQNTKEDVYNNGRQQFVNMQPHAQHQEFNLQLHQMQMQRYLQQRQQQNHDLNNMPTDHQERVMNGTSNYSSSQHHQQHDSQEVATGAMMNKKVGTTTTTNTSSGTTTTSGNKPNLNFQQNLIEWNMSQKEDLIQNFSKKSRKDMREVLQVQQTRRYRA